MVSTTLQPLYTLGGPGIPFTGGWVGLGVGLDSTPPPRLDPRTVQPVASLYNDYAVPVAILYNAQCKYDFIRTLQWKAVALYDLPYGL